MDHISTAELGIDVSQDFQHTRNELSSDDRSRITNALEVIRSTRTMQSSRLESTDHYDEALIEVLRQGDASLPYLKETLTHDEATKDYYLFSEFASTLAEPEDANLVLDVLSSPEIPQTEDELMVSNLTTTMIRLIYTIRSENPDDPRLEKISTRLQSVLRRDFRDELAYKDCLEALAATGTDSAAEFFNDIPIQYIEYIHDFDHYHSDVANIPESHLQRYPPWQTYFRQAQPAYASQSVDMRRNRGLSEDRLNHQNVPEVFDFDDDVFEDWDESNKEAPTLSQPTINLPEPDGFQEMTSLDIEAYTAASIEAVRRYLEVTPHQSTCKPALQLHMFNFIRENTHASDVDLLKELGRFGKLVNTELEAASNSDLPSIGVEVEVPADTFPAFSGSKNTPMTDALIKMGIEVKKEVTFHEPTELELPPSHSAAIQNRMLYELALGGFIPTDPNTFTSMHISLGLTELLDENRDADVALSDILTYAFIPARRIRKGHIAFLDGQIFHGIKEKKLARRIEFRTPRIIGKRTYRLLHETQLLGGLLNKGDDLAQLTASFISEAEKLRTTYNLQPNDPDYQKGVAAERITEAWRIKKSYLDSLKEAEKIENETQRNARIAELKANKPPNLIDEARSIMHRYAQKTAEALQYTHALEEVSMI